MSAPRYVNYWNPTTILATANLVILVFGGGAAYATLRSEIAALREQEMRLEAADVQIRLDAASREARLRVVENGATRIETKLEAIAEGLTRLNTQIERLVDGQP